jgi:hypothetical protein
VTDLRTNHGESTEPTPLGDASLEVRLANLRAWKECVTAKGGKLSTILEARLVALETAAADARLARVAKPFRVRFPALQKWAAEILRTQAKRTALEIAAAYELVAVQCEEAGQWELAARSLDLAARQFDHADAA